MIEYFHQIVNLIIEIAKEENIKDIKLIDEQFKRSKNTASEMIEEFIKVLHFYRRITRYIISEEIDVLTKIKYNFKLSYKLEMHNEIELADCYFNIGDEEKARKILLEFIKNNPDKDEPYQCMQNWYMYITPNMNKLAEVIDLAEKNGHTLITDFGYATLVEHYEKIGDSKNKQKYQEFYDKWKINNED